MRKSKNLLRKSILALAITATIPAADPARACGPFFPTSTLEGGDAALLKAPVADFELEIERLAPTADPHLRAVIPERASWDSDTYRAQQTVAAESADLLAATRNQALTDALTAWRAALHADPAKAGNPPANLPAEFGLYETGAVRYRAKDLDAARRAWQQLLDLPESQRHFRSTWAAYMLGRSYVDTDPAKASAYFQLTRDLAKRGFADTTGLAAASLGWEARSLWKAGQTLPSIHLYLQQAATDDDSAIWSLRDCAAELLAANDARLQQAARDPAARNIITACLLSHFGPYHRDPQLAEKERRWLTLVADVAPDDVAGADRFAWTAYQAGDIPAAQHWLKLGGKQAAKSPIGEWLQGKLALRAGKLDEAATHLARAAHAFPQNEEWPERATDFDPVYRPAEHAAGELAALKLNRGQYVDSLDLLFRNNFWDDAAYVAERVLSADELKRYVDRNWPKFEPVAPAHNPWDETYYARSDVNSLRELLARRLTRIGRWKEARAYFLPEHEKLLDAYVAAIRAGHDAKRSPLDRGRSLFTAARIARNHGMELLATEGDPDESPYGGNFADIHPPRENAAPDERKRFAASAPEPNKRWHYRYVAADLAWDAATLMPDNSDETAELLIESGSWIKAQDPRAADRFYKALVTRCSATSYGRDADELHWLPPLHDKPQATTQPQ